MKTSFWAIQNVLLTAGLCLTTIQLRAQTIAYDVPKGTTGNLAVPEFGVGNDFKVLSPIVISQLGVFDSGGNGIQGGMVLTVVWLIVVMVPPTAIAFHAISLPSGRDYLNPNTGRFWTMDGEGYGNNEDPRSLHKYLYVRDNPVNVVDPSGNIPIVSNWMWGNMVHDKIAENFQFASASFAQRVADIPISQILGLPWAAGTTASRPDLAQYPSGPLPGEVYEIKPEGSWLQGETQLYWYLGLLNGMDPQKRKWAVGSVSNYSPPTTIELATGVFAFVSPPVNGVILYHVEDIRATIAVLATYLTADFATSFSIATLDEALAE